MNENGTLEQMTHYYPFGGVYGDAGLNASLQPYKYNGKELDRMHGLDLYDYGVRNYDAIIGRWTTMDPLAERTPEVSPYAYCKNNPIRYIDPKGEKVRPNGQDEYNMILGTLPQETRSFVVFDRQGFIDEDVINNYNGNDYNTKSLEELVNDPMTVEVYLGKSFPWKIGPAYQQDEDIASLPDPYPMKDISIDPNPDPAHNVEDLSTGETGSIGKTLFPDEIGPQNSPNDNVQIYINSDLSLKGRSEAYSHEANGHVLMYFRTKYNHEAASHHSNHQVDTNLVLKALILKSKMETIKNY
nr:RHS repeat-associated core domain-containing protein [uncultured Prevotella sp.]